MIRTCSVYVKLRSPSLIICIELAKKFIQVFMLDVTGKPKWTFGQPNRTWVSPSVLFPMYVCYWTTTRQINTWRSVNTDIGDFRMYQFTQFFNRSWFARQINKNHILQNSFQFNVMGRVLRFYGNVNSCVTAKTLYFEVVISVSPTQSEPLIKQQIK